MPYHPRYHTSPDSAHFNAPLYLDCCGLVRRVLQDLSSEFGFVTGRWNQAYQFDVLESVEKLEDLKPGDLIFIEGKYYNEKLKPQIHDIVHVEIYLGPQEQTLGARLQHGAIQQFESYQFVSKNYHIKKYHFKSIDRWLQGTNESLCAEHKWIPSSVGWNHGRKSIFNVEENNGEDSVQKQCSCRQQQQATEEEDEAAEPQFE